MRHARYSGGMAHDDPASDPHGTPAVPGCRPQGPTDGAGSTDTPGDELFWLLRGTLRRLRRDAGDQLAPFDLTPSQHRLLRAVARAGTPQRQSALADLLGIVPRSITSVVDDVEAAGLVERAADPTDRRATLVGLTDRGRGVLASADRERRRRADDMLGRLAPPERDELLRLLRVLVHDDAPHH